MPSACCRRCSTRRPRGRWCARRSGIWPAGRLQPIAALVAEEASAKLGAAVEIDVMRPLQAYDAGGRARALATTLQALAQAKEAGLAPGDVAGVMGAPDLSWGPGDTAP